MFVCDSNEKIFQTLPGQGWRVLIEWNNSTADTADGMPATTLEPVIAWVTAKVPRGKYEDVIIAPLVRWPSGDELLILDNRDKSDRKFVFIAPGEELAEAHFDMLKGDGYAKAVARG